MINIWTNGNDGWIHHIEICLLFGALNYSSAKPIIPIEES